MQKCELLHSRLSLQRFQPSVAIAYQTRLSNAVQHASVSQISPPGSEFDNSSRCLLTRFILVRTKRVKEAREEAKREITEYKARKEDEFKKFEAEVISPSFPLSHQFLFFLFPVFSAVSMSFSDRECPFSYSIAGAINRRRTMLFVRPSHKSRQSRKTETKVELLL